MDVFCVIHRGLWSYLEFHDGRWNLLYSNQQKIIINIGKKKLRNVKASILFFEQLDNPENIWHNPLNPIEAHKLIRRVTTIIRGKVVAGLCFDQCVHAIKTRYSTKKLIGGTPKSANLPGNRTKRDKTNPPIRINMVIFKNQILNFIGLFVLFIWMLVLFISFDY